MPQFDWQLVVVVLAVGFSARYLFLRALKVLRAARQTAATRRACGSCGSCSTGEQAPGSSTATFVPLTTLTSDHRPDRNG